MAIDAPFTDAGELLAQVRATPLSPEGVLALVRRLDHDHVDIVRAAFATAQENDEVYAGALLAMAAATAQIRVRPEDVRPFLPELSPRLVPILVGLVSGSRLRLVMDLLGDVALDRETEATLLLTATCLLEGDPPPAALLARIRTMARRELPIAAGMLVGAAAARAGDPDTSSVAERWLTGTEHVRSVLTREAMRSLEGPVVAVLPPPRQKAEGPRTAEKIGRNDPCPCGSGKKYKKCCSGKAGPAADASAPEFPTAGELDRNQSPVDAHDVRGMGLNALARSDFASMPTRPLIDAVRRLTNLHHWEGAGRAMEQLAVRKDLPMNSEPDGYREELIWEAIAAKERDVVRHHLARMTEAVSRERLAVQLAVLDADEATLRRLDELARPGLAGDASDLVDLAHALLDSYPALGILVARGVLDPRSMLDCESLLESIEEARDRLALPPGDPANQIYDALLDGHAADHELDDVKEQLETERRKSAQETDALRRGLRDSSRRLALLEDQLHQHQLRSNHHTGAPQDSHQRAHARDKIAELKQRVADGQEERKELRRQLALALASRPATPAPVAPDPTPDAAEADLDLTPSVRHRVRVPLFSDRARSALSSVPRPIAAQAVRMAGALASGDPAAWDSVKRLQAASPIFSLRLGIHYRLLFRLPQDQDVLDLVALVSREDLLTTIKSFAARPDR